MKCFKSVLCICLAALCLTFCSCGTESSDLTAEYSRSQAIPVYDFYSEDTTVPEKYTQFADAYYDFAANLLVNASSDESCVVSPLSLYTALGMTASGASGKTLSQLEQVLAQGTSIADINSCLYYLNSRVQALNSDDGEAGLANSLWIRDEYSVKAQFLQTIVNYYDAQVFRTNLAGESGAEEINSWISEQTDGEIEEMLPTLSEDTALVLVNAFLFDDEWVTPYSTEDISTGVFNGKNGEESADFMTSNEMLLESTDAKGFIKSYKNTPCKFVAILPDESIDIEDYVASLSGSKLEALLSSASGTGRCVASLPEFELRTNLSLSDTVKAMGAELMFSQNANFGTLTMSEGLFVSDILQESFIQVTPQGTKASSSTSVVMKDSAADSTDAESLVFDRPFVFMIVENEDNLPLYIGVVNTLG